MNTKIWKFLKDFLNIKNHFSKNKNFLYYVYLPRQKKSILISGFWYLHSIKLENEKMHFHSLKIYTKSFFWEIMKVSDIFNSVSWMVCILQIKNWFLSASAKMKIEAIRQVYLPKEITGERFNLVSHRQPQDLRFCHCHPVHLVCKLWLIVKVSIKLSNAMHAFF